MGGSESNEKKCIIESKGVMWGHVTHLSNLGTHLISRDE